MNERLKGAQEVGRLDGILDAHRPGKRHEAFGLRAGGDHVAEVGHREHDEACAVRQRGMKGRERVLHRMLAREPRGGHDEARHRVGEGDVLAGLDVGAVGDGLGQPLREVAHGLERIHVAHEVRTLAHVAFDSVEERVEALVGGEGGRNGDHQLGVDDRKLGKAPRMADADLFPGFGIGDDAARVDFAPRARSRRDGHERERIVFKGLASAGAALHVVPEFAGIGSHEARDLGAVHDGAAAERDEEVAPFGLDAFGHLHDRGDRGVGFDDAHVHDGNAARLKHLRDARERADALHRTAVRGEQQSLCAGQRLGAKGLEPAGTEDELDRGEIDELHEYLSKKVGRVRQGSVGRHCS